MKKQCYKLFILMAIMGIGCGKTEELVPLGVLDNLEQVDSAKEILVEDVVYVHICGSVQVPGVYILTASSRVGDVVNAAGGMLADAATSEVNLAKKIEDGMQIIIPSLIDNEVLVQETQELEGKININTASQSQLCTLPGIGESRALDIIAYRENNGGFKKIEDIMNVTGIKTGIYEGIESLIYVP